MHAICRAQMHREIGIPCDIDTTRLPCPKIGRCSDKSYSTPQKNAIFDRVKKKRKNTIRNCNWSLSFYREMEIGRDTRHAEFFMRGETLGNPPLFLIGHPIIIEFPHGFPSFCLITRRASIPLDFIFPGCCRRLGPRNFVRVRAQASILPR